MGEDALRALVERTSRAPDPCESLRILTAPRRGGDQLERENVARALAAGRSFADVAQALGVSRQAAHRRYRHLAGTVPPERASEPVTPLRPGTRLAITSEARQAFSYARDEARALGAVRVGTEHLLLGMLRSDGPAIADTLVDLGVTLDLARAHAEPTAVTEQVVVNGDGPVASVPAPPPEGISRYLRSVLERA